MEITINKNAVILELARRVQENENGVRGYLTEAGIEVGSEGVSLQQLNTLREINPAKFEEMLRFLYPEMKRLANGDGGETSATIKTKSGSKWSASDWTGMVGTLLSGTVGILGSLNINGNTDAMAKGAAYDAEAARAQAEKEKKQMRTTIAIVCVGFLVIVIAGVLIFRHRK